ncbi:hypothetical protein VSS74_06755 [Conexibacter stalactiti]|uniref:Serine hydrolase n=1 Tax=Conexibacter stalactiti TaxID=1940611 RepID=A0ABU4HL47_9ACTN|nr:hypothetical protein [Conexibacter stalactiti]MDW5594026.1 hypothetical protein [Conexibacter stalactiti]MEC5034668.1 hypothetical protein [Conexibacter stalactiti]
MPARALTLLAILVCLLTSACGESGGETASTAVADAVGDGNIAESRAIEQEAKVEALREQVARLKQEQKPARAEQTPEEEQASRGGSNRPPAGADSAGGGTILSADAQQSFEQLAGALSGPVGLAVSGVGIGQPVEQLGSLQSAVAWSTSKVPVAMAAIAAGVADSGDLSAAIAASDNAAATNLWNALGGGTRAATAADAQLRASGDTSTTIQPETLRSGFTPFGQTDWSLAAQAQFTAGMACSAPGQQVLGLMGETISAQRWGLGSIGSSSQLKGGWGPGSVPGQDGGYLDRQMGVVTVDGKPLAVAIAAQPADGSHETGTSELTQLANWVAEHVNAASLPASASC